MLDLIEIKIFCAVVDRGGLTAAADTLGMPKSTMSRRLTQLEQRVGQPLLRRQSNRLQLTEAGRLFESYARQMLRLSQQGLQVIEDLREEVSGELQVRCHPVCVPARVLSGAGLVPIPKVTCDMSRWCNCLRHSMPVPNIWHSNRRCCIPEI